MSFRRFDYRTAAALRADIAAQGLDLPWSDDLSPLLTPLTAGRLRLKNRLVCQPMEGNDGDPRGAPTALTHRRYHRLAAGGAGLVWMESLAIRPDSRTGPTMLMLTPDTVDEFRRLLDGVRAAAPGEPPVLVAQLTHCGRFARLDDVPPVAAHENPHLPGRPRILSDAELAQIGRDYVAAARLAAQAGFDAIDVRACHGYLLSELLGGFTRPGPYGGSFENRCRLLLEIVDGIAAVTDLPLVTRLNAYDAVPKPYGWGADERGAPDLSEPVRLVRLLYARGLRLFNLSATLGPFFPWLQRPSDRADERGDTGQLVQVARMHGLAAELKRACPEAAVVASSFTWLRQYGAHLAAGGVAAGRYDLAGWGRQTYAYPDFANDIRAGELRREKCCVCCSHCIRLMAAHAPTGCIVRDSQTYLPLFKALPSTH